MKRNISKFLLVTFLTLALSPIISFQNNSKTVLKTSAETITPWVDKTTETGYIGSTSGGALRKTYLIQS